MCKKILLLISLLFTTIAFSQVKYCGTNYKTDTTLYKFRQFNAQRPSTGSAFSWADPNHPCKKATIKIFVHNIKNDNGSLGNQTNISSLSTSILSNLNAAFNVHQIYFELKGSDEINSSLVYNGFTFLDDFRQDVDGDGKFDNFSPNVNNDAIDIYILQNWPTGSIGAKTLVNGVAAETGSTALVLFGQSNTPLNFKTLIHEMGHCLGLYHTFHGACGTQEPGLDENENNPFYTGDFVDDTPPDPTDIIDQTNANCVNNNFLVNLCTGNTRTPAGNLFNPLPNNHMDYLRDNCKTAFTSGQGLRMLTAIANNSSLQSTLKKETGNTLIITSSATKICNGTSVLLQGNASNNKYYYDWQDLSNAQNLTVSPNVTTTYILKAWSYCEETLTQQVTITVNDNAAPVIIGSSSICFNNTGNTYTIQNTSNTAPNGTWSVNNTALATISSGGVLTPSTSINNTVTISYNTLSTPSNCAIATTKNVSIIPANSTVNINTTRQNVCKGDESTLIASGTNGLSYNWTNTSSPSIILSTASSYTFKPTSNGTYNLNTTTACGEVINRTITINSIDLPMATVTPISQPLCSGGSVANVNFNYNYPSNDINANWYVVDAFTNNIVSGLLDDASSPKQLTSNLPGTYKIVADLFLSPHGCHNLVNSEDFFVTALNPQIFGNNTICTSKTYDYTSDAKNGIWSLSNTTIATINPSTGKLVAIASGATTISYEVDVCGTQKTITKNIIIETTPTLTGNQVLSLCNPTYSFTATPNTGTWGSDNPSFATVSGGGIVTPLKEGNARITYQPLPNVCVTDRLLLEVTIIPCVTTPCSNVKSIPIIGNGTLNAINNGVFNNGVFIIYNDITITGNVNFFQSQILVSPNVKITVANGGFLNIENSHFYSCNGMWQGFEVLGNNAKIQIQQNSLIEDAVLAVYYKPATLIPNYGTGKVLRIINTVFNRNEESILIEDFEDDYLGGDLPIEIGNCIFTSRNLPFDPQTIAWESVEAIRNTSLVANTPYLQTPLSYTSPYINATIYPSSFLKVGTSEMPKNAIVLNNVGKKIGNNFKGITIGMLPETFTTSFSKNNTTVFDNHNFGIISTNTNINVQNCSFQNPKIPSGWYAMANGFGIFAGCTNGILNNININTPIGSPNNSFYGLNTAISVKAYQANISNNDIRSNLGFTNKTQKAIQASSSYFNNIIISNNNIHNVANGIWFGTGGDLMATQIGIVNISNNNIASALPNLPIANGYVRNAINLDASFMGTEGNLQPAICSNNTITNAVNGIKASGYSTVFVENNHVTLKQDAATNPISNQFGICLEAGWGANTQTNNKIESNTVIGYNLNSNTTGILLNQQTGTFIGCNKVGNLQHGFRFFGFNPLTKFNNNTMLTTNKYGFTLDNGGIIEKQGNENNANGMICTSDNNWEQPSSYWQSLSNQYMSNCINSDATQSPLVINTSYPLLNPEGSNNSIGGAIPYQASNGSLIPAISNALCTRCGGLGNYARQNAGTEILEEIAQGYVNIPNDEPTERLLVMQDQLYKVLQANPDLQAQNENLEKFVQDNAWSGLDFIHFTGYYFAQNNIPMVTQLLSLWPATTSSLQNNYKLYFNWMVQTYNDPNWTPNLQTCFAMANKCPIKQGNIIYAFRNLYNYITQEIHEFEDNCDGAAARGGNGNTYGFIRLKQKPIASIVNKSNVKVFPNPASTFVNVECKNISSVQVHDILGRIVINNKYNNSNRIQLNISNLRKGIYIIRITTIDGKLEKEKFIIN